MKSSTRNRRRVSVMLALAMLTSYLPTPGYSLLRHSTRNLVAKNSIVTSEPGGKTSAPFTAAPNAQVREAFGKLPISFEPNRGQFDKSVKFMARGGGYTMFLTATETVFVMRGERQANQIKTSKAVLKQGANSIDGLQRRVNTYREQEQERRGRELAARTVVRMKLTGANDDPVVTGMEELPGRVNYFRTNNPRKWASDLPVYSKVQYKSVYPGIDLVYHSGQQQLEYDFVVTPGADPSVIALNFEGAERVEVDAPGNLLIHAKDRVLRQQKPAVYQDANGKRQPVESRFVIRDNQVGFELGSYNIARPLIIDPVLSYSTFLGDEENDDNGFDITVDNDGNAYVVGYTQGETFPTVDPFQSVNYDFNQDVFLTKFNPEGSQLIFSTYLGGTFDEAGYSIALDSERNVYLTGYTDSADFPRHNALQQSCGSTVDSGFGATMQCSEDEAFVTKFSAAGNHLIFSTYLGGSGPDRGRGIAVDSSQNVYVTGFTQSYNFPTTQPIQRFLNAHSSLQESRDAPPFSDAFLTKIEPGGQFRIYSTFIGGGKDDVAMGVALDSSGDAYLTGFTDSTDVAPTPPEDATPTPTPTPGPTPTSTPVFPTTEGAFQTQPSDTGGTRDAFVTKVNAAGSGFVFSSFIGGSEDDEAYGIAVGADDSAYITGYTDSPGNRSDATNSLAAPVFSGSGFPTTVDAYQTQNNGGYDAFITRFAPDGSGLLYSSFIGGDKDEGQGANTAFHDDNFDGAAIAVDFAGNAFITGWTDSTTPVAAPTPTPVCASSFNYTDFSSTSGITLNGSATPYPSPSPVVLRLTPDLAAQSGSAFYSTQVNGASNFTTTFSFRISVTDDTGAEGFAFNLTNDGDTTIPTEGEKGTVADLSVSFDTYNNGGSDPSGNFVSVYYRGGQVATQDLDLLDTPINLSDGNSHTATINYDPDTQGVSVSIDGAFVLVATADLSVITQPTFVGFSARTTSFSETHDILSWSFSGAPTCPEPVSTTFVNFPTKNAVQPVPGGSNSRDAFVAKFNTNAAGEASLIYSTFLGGYQRDEGQGIAVDLAGNAYVTGRTGDSECSDCCEVANGQNLSASAVCGKTGATHFTAHSANATAAPSVSCLEDNNFPTTPGSFNPSKCDEVNSNFDQDAFVTKIGGSDIIGDPNNPTFSIVGRVTRPGGVGVADVTITVTQNDLPVATATTVANGSYEVSGLAPGGYIVTPSISSENDVFSPPNQAVTLLDQNVRADFTATQLFSISGHVTEGGTGLSGVTITVTKQSDSSVVTATTTDSNGNYIVENLKTDAYVVTPTKPFYIFTPESRTIEALTSDRTDFDFAATRQQFAIAGHITTSVNPLSGVIVSLSGDASGTTTTNANGDYNFGNVAAGGNYTVTPSRPNTVFTPPSRTITNLNGNVTADFTATPGEVGFTAAASPAGSESSRNEGAGSFQITIARTGDTSGATDVDYATFDGPPPGPSPAPSPVPPAALETSDYITALGRLHFAAGQTARTISIFIVDDAFVEGNETLSLVLSNPTNGVTLSTPSGITLTIVDNDTTPTNVNPIDTTSFFVRQHYIDFLNREPDAAGLAFWSKAINDCSNPANRGPNETEAHCIDRMRVQVSKAFFLSIEFQETGFFVIRTYRAALHRYPEFREFLRDTQEIQRGVVVGQGSWEAQLAANRQAYLRDFVRRPEFLARYPQTQTRDQYLDALFASADFTPTPAERAEVSNAYDGGGADQNESRARALGALADHARFRGREFNPAFVTMQYIGYLRRNPDDPGFNFWLTDLNGSNDQNHMVRAFIVSMEYRQRFGEQ